MKRSASHIGLVAGPACFVLTLLFVHSEGLSWEAKAVLASTIWIAIWWITEAIPIAATALLPLILFPLMNAADVGDTASAYGSPIVFLFLGGFLIAMTIERWNLHKRIALQIVNIVGTGLGRIILGFMLASALLSMWISNTATTVMMMPIGMAMVKQLSSGLDDVPLTPRQLGQALMLSIAYASSIGGMASIIGTPTNAIFTGVVSELYGIEIGFSEWMMFGLPVALILLGICWVYIVRRAYKIPADATVAGGREEIQRQIKSLGKMSVEEKRVLTIFVLIALSWTLRSYVLQPILPGISDSTIAMLGTLAFFIIPSSKGWGDGLLDWSTAEKMPWGILILFGGGLAIAGGFKTTGLAQWIGEQLSLLEAVPYLILILILIAAVNFLTEVTSNVATASMLLPILAAMAFSIDVHPYGLMIAATLAASCAFMLPVATPPNAVVFGSGYLTIPDMMKVGVWLNIISIVFLTMVVYLFLPLIWGIDLFSFPDILK